MISLNFGHESTPVGFTVPSNEIIAVNNSSPACFLGTNENSGLLPAIATIGELEEETQLMALPSLSVPVRFNCAIIAFCNGLKVES